MPRTSSAILALIGALSLSAPAFAQPLLDHLGCYKVKDATPKGRFNLLTANVGVTQSCLVKTPAKFGCLETRKSDIVPVPPGGGPTARTAGHFLCYKMKCGKPHPQDAQMTDQFGGTRVVDFKAGQFLCAPAIRGAEVQVTPTTTTTLPGQSGECRFNNDDRRCEGSCGGGGRCAATVESGACECRTTACGDADSPECNGFCQDSDEACIFSIDGCSCVRIP